MTLDEVKILANTPCDFPILKSASIFSCMTGLRISDVLKLDWQEILPASDGGYCMRLRTEKTETETTLPISDEALELCGERSKGKVFKGLTKTMTQQPLKDWVASAGITKHITLHCLRHRENPYELLVNQLSSIRFSIGNDLETNFVLRYA